MTGLVLGFGAGVAVDTSAASGACSYTQSDVIIAGGLLGGTAWGLWAVGELSPTHAWETASHVR